MYDRYRRMAASGSLASILLGTKRARTHQLLRGAAGEDQRADFAAREPRRD